ncbi:MAG: hypothetical protein HY606_06615 [Planctomycetes bacterium]|nr:hypothetical protein [Planctomycetota bacterium]
MLETKKKDIMERALERGKGILRLFPAWVPRSFLFPGRRLKLATQDLYAIDPEHGGVGERWLSSTTMADNGPGTPEDQGLSYVVAEMGSKTERVLLRDGMELMGERLLGEDAFSKHGGWNVLTKFFDYQGLIPHHIHQMDEHAEKVGAIGKPESYYFPPQLNFIVNSFPYTFFGLQPGTTKEDIKNCLKKWNQGDNGILNYSKAYALIPGTGWNLPAGILHAPGTLLTYEVQRSSDVFSIFQSMIESRPIPWDLVVKDVPAELHHDLDYIISMLDWEKNVDPEFVKHYYVKPKPADRLNSMQAEGYVEKWVIYGSEYYSAKELTVLPGKTVTIRDQSAYGLIVVQGHGRVGSLEVESPTLIHAGEMTADELFVTHTAARQMRIENTSKYENLVMLKHFGPGNPDAPTRTEQHTEG